MLIVEEKSSPDRQAVLVVGSPMLQHHIKGLDGVISKLLILAPLRHRQEQRQPREASGDIESQERDRM